MFEELNRYNWTSGASNNAPSTESTNTDGQVICL